MSKDNDYLNNSASILDEIENQLEDMLSQKKGEIQRELEEKITREKEEAKKKMESMEKEVEEEKQVLSNYRDVFTQFESKKENLKKQLKEHLDKAVQYQTEIEAITGKTLEELKIVNELSQEIEEIQQEAEEKAASIKRELEENYGIEAQIPEGESYKEMDFNLDEELAKLNKIKELLGKEEKIETEEKGKEEEIEEKEAKEEKKEEVISEVQEKKREVAPEEEEAEEERKPQEEEIRAGTERDQVDYAPFEISAEEEEREEEKREEEYEEEKEEDTFQDTFNVLEQFRRSEPTEDNGVVKYFQNEDKLILDGEAIISELEQKIEEVKKLYIKLSQTESPREQFFIKQEIIKHQENLRKLMLRSVRMCENESCSLPNYTLEILNVGVLKNILEKISMENWSNHDDFTSFENYINDLKYSYRKYLTPHSKYIQSLAEELGIHQK